MLLFLVLSFAPIDLNCHENCHEEVELSYDKDGKPVIHKTGSIICDGGLFANCQEN